MKEFIMAALPWAFLGVNGAGKSTTISILCGQLAKDSGSIIIAEKALTEIWITSGGSWAWYFRIPCLTGLFRFATIRNAGAEASDEKIFQ